MVSTFLPRDEVRIVLRGQVAGDSRLQRLGIVDRHRGNRSSFERAHDCTSCRRKRSGIDFAGLPFIFSSRSAADIDDVSAHPEPARTWSARHEGAAVGKVRTADGRAVEITSNSKDIRSEDVHLFVVELVHR